jgi:hypothetical protein
MEFHSASVDGIDYCDASVDPVAGNVEASNRLANLHQVEGSFGIIHTDIMFLTLSCNVLFLILRKQERF